jgi:hypothetical protein
MGVAWLIRPVVRKTARRYVQAAAEEGPVRDGGAGQLTDELVGQVAEAVRPVRPGGHGRPWEQLEACQCQIDFGYLGLLADPVSGRRQKVHALIFTACYSRHMFVWLSFTQTLAAFVAGCDPAWVFFGGVFKVLVPDNASAIVAYADAVNPRSTAGWLDYAQHCGFATDTARVRSPMDKPRVERAVRYVRGNYFADEAFTGLADTQARVAPRHRRDADPRHHPIAAGGGVRRA